ncbi:hypothetical protein [Apis mellifera associated microvirus 58]|nr:hypothetical protein [Apis mellifera associated microvirus 58]
MRKIVHTLSFDPRSHDYAHKPNEMASCTVPDQAMDLKMVLQHYTTTGQRLPKPDITFDPDDDFRHPKAYDLTELDDIRRNVEDHIENHNRIKQMVEYDKKERSEAVKAQQAATAAKGSEADATTG